MLFQDIFDDGMDGIPLLDRVIDPDIIEKPIEHTVNLFDILGDDSVEIASEFRIIKFIPQQLSKGLDGDQGVFEAMDQFKKKERGVGAI